MTSNYT